jgi:hypothetical protein
MARTTRSSAGEYSVTDGKRIVRVSYFEHLKGWVAAAEWDRCLYTDPLPTKRDAVFNATLMLASD